MFDLLAVQGTLKSLLQHHNNFVQQYKKFYIFGGKIEGRRSRQQRIRWLGGIIDKMGKSSNKLWERLKDRETWGAAAHGVTKSQMRLSD